MHNFCPLISCAVCVLPRRSAAPSCINEAEYRSGLLFLSLKNSQDVHFSANFETFLFSAVCGNSLSASFRLPDSPDEKNNLRQSAVIFILKSCHNFFFFQVHADFFHSVYVASGIILTETVHCRVGIIAVIIAVIWHIPDSRILQCHS